jgi:hypothetical protein
VTNYAGPVIVVEKKVCRDSRGYRECTGQSVSKFMSGLAGQVSAVFGSVELAASAGFTDLCEHCFPPEDEEEKCPICGRKREQPDEKVCPGPPEKPCGYVWGDE